MKTKIKPEIKPEDLSMAICRLSLMQFFPTDPMQQRALALELENLCGHREGLEWLVSQLLNHVPKWPGFAEVRGIYCVRYRPADGIEAYSTIGGFTPEACEAKNYESETNITLPRGEAAGLLTSILPEGKALAIKTIPQGRIVNTQLSTEGDLK